MSEGSEGVCKFEFATPRPKHSLKGIICDRFANHLEEALRVSNRNCIGICRVGRILPVHERSDEVCGSGDSFGDGPCGVP